ncbi:MAG: hypothetical protein ACREWI_09350 [Telluria sp.]
MEITARVTVRGAKFFRGNLDGKDIDSGKIFCDVELKGETSWGTCTDEMKCEGSKLIESIKHNPFPFVAELTMIQESNGKVSTQKVIAIKPLQAVKEAKASS